MAKDRACKGEITIGGSSLAHLTDWEVDKSADAIDSSTMGGCAKEEIPGPEAGAVNGTCYFDDAGDAGQAAIVVGTSTPVAIVVNPFGTGSGLPTFTGNVRFLTKRWSANVNGLPQLQFTASADENGITEGSQP